MCVNKDPDGTFLGVKDYKVARLYDVVFPEDDQISVRVRKLMGK